jgi:hypothetical protein
MAIKLEDYLAKLPEERQQAIKERTAELIAEEATLRQIREARDPSQEDGLQAGNRCPLSGSGSQDRPVRDSRS